MKRVIESISHNRPISAIKLCHGFWEHCVRIKHTRISMGLELPLDESNWARVLRKHHVNWPPDLFMELVELLRSANERPDVQVMVSPFGWSEGYTVEGTPVEGLENTEAIIDEMIHPDTPLHDGLLWKNSVQKGEFVSFIEAIRDRQVTIVGPPHVSSFGDFIRLPKSHFVAVDGRRAAWERHEILERIGNTVKDHAGEGGVCLIQAGGVTSAWLVYQLAERFPRSSFLSLGRVLDLAHFPILRNMNWYFAHHTSINSAAHVINPDWHGMESTENGNEATVDQLWERRFANYHPGLEAILREPSTQQGTSANGGVDFVENKAVDYALVDRLLERSLHENRFANFGPVSKLLETSLQELLGLPANREVVVCKSATDAIHGLVAAHEIQAGHELNWVVSAFGFFSTHIGPLSNARVIDCDQDGLIDRNFLCEIEEDHWDGVVITNPFASARDLNPIIQVAKEFGKRVIVDNAAALFTPTRDKQSYPDEAISFHQTKPWGLGEGGCAVASSEVARIFRALTNFGVGLDEPVKTHAMNSKLSDFDAALILQRLINLPNWRPLYEMQRRRLLSIALPLGLRPLGGLTGPMLQAHVPLIAPRPVSRADLANSLVTLQKYYRPLESDHQVASDLYDHILCVPCHPGMKNCATKDLHTLLSRFAS